MFSREFDFSSKVWIWSAQKGSWHFVSLPKKISQEIKEGYPFNDRGFGSVPVEVTVGTTTWNTSIFPDSKTNTYVMPLKAAVRKKEGIEENQEIEVHIIISF